GEWLKPTDCKSVPPCEVRRFESFPVHQTILAVVAQLVERVLGKDEVTSSILVNGSRSDGLRREVHPEAPAAVPAKRILWQKRNSIAQSRTSTSGRSGTSIMARRP